MSRVLLPHVEDHEFEIATEELMEKINKCFVDYENAAHSDMEWACNTHHSRLDGILYALDAMCALSTDKIRAFMVSCTDAQHLPFGYTRFRT